MTGMAEAVADYPRPPRLERSPHRIRIVFAGQTILATSAAWRVLETHHPPTYYLLPGDFLPGVLRPGQRGSVCEWKGEAVYFSLVAEGRTARNAAWSYPDPTHGFRAITDHVAVYAGPMDACFVGEHQVLPQPGGFYGGWITPDLIGPFKGGPGTAFW